jgi:HK97 gp10 family phage protein
MSESVKLTGIDEMKRQLTELPARIRKQRILDAALMAAAADLRDTVKRFAPVKTGALRDNIIAYRDRHPEKSGATSKYSVFVRKVKISRKVRKLLRKVHAAGANLKISDYAFYWKFIEYGTSKYPAHPFFRTAIATRKDSFVKTVGDSLQQGIDHIVKRIGAK